MGIIKTRYNHHPFVEPILFFTITNFLYEIMPTYIWLPNYHLKPIIYGELISFVKQSKHIYFADSLVSSVS